MDRLQWNRRMSNLRWFLPDILQDTISKYRQLLTSRTNSSCSASLSNMQIGILAHRICISLSSLLLLDQNSFAFHPFCSNEMCFAQEMNFFRSSVFLLVNPVKDAWLLLLSGVTSIFFRLRFRTCEVTYFVALGVNAVNDVNSAISLGGPDAVLRSLQNPALQLQNVDPANITHYLRLLNKKKLEKMEETGDPNAMLWIDEIQNCINTGNYQTKQALKRKLSLFFTLAMLQ